jgi:hypothetical protein
MNFEFAKYTEITDYAMKHNPDYKASGYERIFICPDVWDFWLVRILKGYRNDEEEGYVEDPIILSWREIKLKWTERDRI